MNSFNHYSFGACTEGMYEYSLGMRPSMEAVGLRKMTFAPAFDPSGKVTFAKGHYDSDFGRISVEWHAEDGGFVYEVTCPAQIEAEYHFDGYAVARREQNGDTVRFFLK